MYQCLKHFSSCCLTHAWRLASTQLRSKSTMCVLLADQREAQPDTYPCTEEVRLVWLAGQAALTAASVIKEPVFLIEPWMNCYMCISFCLSEQDTAYACLACSFQLLVFSRITGDPTNCVPVLPKPACQAPQTRSHGPVPVCVVSLCAGQPPSTTMQQPYHADFPDLSHMPRLITMMKHVIHMKQG